jgi:catalase
VRFHWIPVAGARNVDPAQVPRDEYLQQELRARVADGPVRFLLMMTIGEAGDDFNDPSRSWPPHRVRVMMGTLTIDSVPTDQIECGEKLSFNPWRLVDGIKPSDDPILRLRHEAYEFSRQRRNGHACPFARS